MLILGISGRKQSGKSTAGNFMYSLYMHEHKIAEEVYIDELGRIVVSDLFGDQNYSGVFDPTKRVENDYMISKVFKKLDPIVKIYNFAEPLKNLCIDILGLKHSQCYGTDEQKNQKVDCYWDNKQLTAREVMQIVGTDMLRTMQKNVWSGATVRKITKEKPKLAIITDCRFPNEVDAIKSAGGIVARLTRNVHDSEHISESILDKDNYDWGNFDYVLDNKSIDLLDQLVQIKEMMGEIL
jgi:hypothetical protein